MAHWTYGSISVRNMASIIPECNIMCTRFCHEIYCACPVLFSVNDSPCSDGTYIVFISSVNHFYLMQWWYTQSKWCSFWKCRNLSSWWVLILVSLLNTNDFWVYVSSFVSWGIGGWMNTEDNLTIWPCTNSLDCTLQDARWSNRTSKSIGCTWVVLTNQQ